ncbi:uncharacterized protein LOC134282764 [Saccostrea cucullata]|uniref:uncharacterized protein LOC134282764 n=1 Tax=Saccostrea cuccullata TaxID=36930 RepID=UPI002ED1D0E7
MQGILWNAEYAFLRIGGYVGCFKEQLSKTLNGKHNTSDSMTVENCKEFCQHQDTQFYGLKSSGKCFCVNSLSQSVKTADKECSSKCSGNGEQICGGDRRISVYKNANYQKGYLGCFLYQPGITLRNGKYSRSYPSVEKCKTFCGKQNAHFYGLAHGNQCLCGDRGRTVRKGEIECSHLCSGNGNEFCGGHWRISLYINRNYDKGYVGCFQDQSSKTLNGKHNTSDSMTVENCKEFCQHQDTQFYGLKSSSKCFCVNSLSQSVKTADKECSSKCSGNGVQICGGDRRISVYKNVNYQKGYLGCFLYEHGITLRNGKYSRSYPSVEKCKTFCGKQNAHFYGLAHGNQCLCGDRGRTVRKGEIECSHLCSGNGNEFCGGHWRISLYINRNYDKGYVGCFQDQSSKTLNGKHNTSDSMTVENCKEFCQHQDTQFYGLKSSSKCFCVNSLSQSVKTADKECSSKCSGNGVQICGGDRRISVYKNVNYQKGYLGCFLYEHGITLRNGKYSRSYPSVEKCKTFCGKQNAHFYGLAHGNQCLCGDRGRTVRKGEIECSHLCSGNGNEFCGGHWRISLYINRNYDKGYVGCFQDQSSKTLNGKHNTSDSMTVENCKEFCQHQDTQFYGLKSSSKCFCVNSLSQSVKTADKECSSKCSGNEEQICGGDRRISVYKNVNYQKGYLGCFLYEHGITLRNGKYSRSYPSVEKCKTFCGKQNAHFYGLAHGNQCLCGDRGRTVRKGEIECSHLCSGNGNEFCGGYWRISLYINRNYDKGYVGCFQDQSSKTLNGKHNTSDSMTVENCKEFCQHQDTQFYGLKSSSKCFCVNSLSQSVKTADKECSSKCSGNEEQICGGDRRISVYKNVNYQKGYLGCFLYQPGITLRNGKYSRSYPSVEKCKTFCGKQNAQFYGLAHGNQCLCGDRGRTVRKGEIECSHLCSGNGNEFCGGHWRISLYINRNYDNGMMIQSLELQDEQSDKKGSKDTRHHDQKPSIQASFANDVHSLVCLIKDLGNPFDKLCKDLLVLDTKELSDQSAFLRASRVDLVWEKDIDNSLKGNGRAKRGKRKQIRVTAESTVPRDWQDFLE